MEMKWSVVAVLLVSLTSCNGAVFKCKSIDPECVEKESEDKIVDARIGVKDVVSLEAECLPGSEWESNCHSCRCSGAGVAQCARIAACEKEMEDLEPIHCAPNSTFARDCNTCVCLQDGRGLCTLRICRPAVVSKPVTGVGRDCAAGTSWRSQCNTCTCSADGYSSCTQKACLGQENESTWRCAPDSSWMSDCNSCWCSPQGLAICTKIACSGAEVTLHFDDDDDEIKEESHNNNKTIKEEEPLKINLNMEQSHNMVKRAVCKPSASFQHECNLCRCSADGSSYHCTQNECMNREEGVDKGVDVFMESEGSDHIERHSVCKPASTFYIGCNTCRCNHDGTDYTCTNKPCPLPEDVELFHELKQSKSSKNKTIVCVANRMFIRDCNTCWCNEDGTGYFCTRKVCVQELTEADDKPEELRIIKRKCRPDEVFEMDCNTCRCDKDGESYSCTRRACITEPPVSEPEDQKIPLSRRIRGITASDGKKTCTPSQEFRLDCNKCLCDNSGQDFSCTRIDCSALNNNNNNGARRRREAETPPPQSPEACTPGAVFTRGCDVCRCERGGGHAACALRPCQHGAALDDNEHDTSEPEGESNFRCNPGEQFRRGCTDCTCAADGRGELCTLRVCDRDLTPRL